MRKLISCEYNLDTGMVELHYADGYCMAIDTIAVENEYADNIISRSELDWLIYNKPLEYADIILSGEIESYLNTAPIHKLED